MRHWLVLGLVLGSVEIVAAEPEGSTPTSDAALHLGRAEGLGLVTAPVANAVGVASGWDGARDGLVATARGELVVVPHLAIVGGAQHDAGATWRPYAGAKLAFGPGLSVAAVYKAEGFAEPEGELELTFGAGHRLGPGYVAANLSYGQDLDARDRDAEVAVAVVAPITSVVASITSRARFALGSPSELAADWDVVTDAGAALPFGRYAVRAAVGVSVVGAMRVTTGPLAILAISAYF